MIDHDRLFKELLSTFFAEFVDLFFPDLSQLLERDSLVFLEKELFSDVTAGERVEADLVVQTRLRAQDSFFLVHVENQAESQLRFPYRMFRYFARLHEKYQLPIYPIALFSFEEPQRAEPSVYRVEFANFLVLEFHYRTIQLNRLDWRSYLRQPNPVAAALMAKMNMTPAERSQVKLECLRMLATLRLDPARMQMISGFVDTYLRLSAEEEGRFSEELARISPAEREGVVQIITSWMEKGLEQGLEQGREQGRDQEARTIVLRQLERRIGALEPSVREQIAILGVEDLEGLSEALLDFSGPEDLQSWLGAVGEPG